MDRSRAIGLLPEAYAEALQLDENGLAHLIPERLGIPTEAVGPLLRLARAKLAALGDAEPNRTASGPGRLTCGTRSEPVRGPLPRT